MASDREAIANESNILVAALFDNEEGMSVYLFANLVSESCSDR